MAVRICPVCGGKVASTRSTCSHCGYEMKATKKCPECEEVIPQDSKECPICGYEFDSIPMAKVPEEKPTPRTKSVVNNSTSQQEVTSDTMVAKFFKKATKEQFLRSVFYHLTKNNKSPADILNAKFGEVEEGEAQGFSVYGKANGHYTASIGYDRKEVYYESERKYDSTIKDYRYVNVEKTRTVTDWQPFNGNITNEGCSAVVVEPKYILLEKCFYELLKRKDLEEIHEEYPDDKEVPSEVYSKGKTALSQNVRNGIRFPGDHVKDVSCDVSISDYKVFRCIVPTYKVFYEYEGIKYYAEGFAIDGCTPFFTLPETSSSALSETKLRDQEKAEVTIAEKPKKLASFLGGLAIVLAVCSFVFGLSFSFIIWIVGFSVVGCSAAAAITLAIITSVKVKKLHAEYDTKVEKLKILKGLLLNKKLTEYGFEKITETEKIYLDLMDVDLDVEDFDLDALLSAPAATNGSTVSNPRVKKKVSNPRVKKKGALIAMWSSIGFTILAYLVTAIFSLIFTGSLHWMFIYLTDGYIAGFICMGVGIIGYVTSLCFLWKSKGINALKITSIILILAILCITFVPLIWYDPFLWTKNGDGTYNIADVDYSGSVGITIPSTHKGVPVTSVGNFAFSNATLESIYIPDSITSIGYDAFYYCRNLTSITIPDSVTSIGDLAFFGCDSLTSVVIGDSVTSIGDSAFNGCDSLTSVVIGDSVTSIDYDMFSGCPIEYMTVPASLINSIPKENLKTVVINGGESIGDWAFSGCSNLTSITIPDSVTSIGYYAFYGCSNLTSVYYLGTAEEWEEISIESNNAPLTSATRYYYSENQPTTIGNYWHYDYNGNIVVW